MKVDYYWGRTPSLWQLSYTPTYNLFRFIKNIHSMPQRFVRIYQFFLSCCFDKLLESFGQVCLAESFNFGKFCELRAKGGKFEIGALARARSKMSDDGRSVRNEPLVLRLGKEGSCNLLLFLCRSATRKVGR